MAVKRASESAEPRLRSGERISGWTLGRVLPTPDRVPPEWGLWRLTDVARLESGHTPSRRRPEYWKGDIPWISLHDSNALDGPEISTTAQTIGPLGLANSSARLLPPGTVVFSRTATVGKATTMGREMATSQDFANYVCGPAVHNQYLVHLFRHMEPEWDRLKAGSTHNSIYMPVFRELEVLLPSVPEQHLIAAALGDVDALLDSLDRLIAKKRDIKQATMQQLLTGKTRLPGFDDSWETLTLGQLFEFRNGVNANKGAYGRGIQFINVLEVINRPHLRAADVPGRVELPGHVRESFQVRRGDVLFNRTSETQVEVALASVYLDEVPVVFGGFVIRGRPCDRRLDAVYSGYALRSKEVREQVIAKGQGAIRANVGQAELGTVRIHVPSLPEQMAIAAVLSDMDAEISALEARRGKTRAIKQGMMQELLTGRTRLA